MLNRILLYIRRHQMLQAGDRVAAAVSGGADSVALLEVLHRLRDRLGITIAVAHYNHRLRGAESQGDERFVAQLAADRGLPFFAESSTAPAETNIEAAARRERYAFLGRLVESGRASKVATAHTADDQAETVLGRLLRGSGTAGFAGIYPVWEGYLIRPLLGCGRAELRAWAAGEGLKWREDSSNLDPRFLRNRLRQELIPRLQKDYNPALVEVLAGVAEVARAEEQFWQARTEDLAARLLEAVPGGWKLPLEPFVQLQEAEQRRLLREALRKLRPPAPRPGARLRPIEFRHVEQARLLAKSPSGREALVPGCRVERALDALMFRAVPARAGRAPRAVSYQYSLEVPGVCQLPEAGSRLSFKLVKMGREVKGYNLIGTECVAALDSVRNPVTVRNWHPGDVLETSRGRKKLKTLLLERRIPREERRVWPVVTSGDQLVWARGLPVARPFRWDPAAIKGGGKSQGLLIEEELLNGVAGSSSGCRPDGGADPDQGG